MERTKGRSPAGKGNVVLHPAISTRTVAPTIPPGMVTAPRTIEIHTRTKASTLSRNELATFALPRRCAGQFRSFRCDKTGKKGETDSRSDRLEIA